MSNRKQLIAFDLDGTLAPSKSSLPSEVNDALVKLIADYTVCVMSGGQFKQFELQLLNNLTITKQYLPKLHLMPCCGTQYYTYDTGRDMWIRQYSETLTEDERKRAIDALNQALDATGYRESEPYGDVIEDRESQITMSALGQDVVAALGDEGIRLKEAWDPDSTKKRALRDYAAKLIPDLEVRVGGISSVDVTKPGVDKAYGMQKMLDLLHLQKDDVIYIGDRLEEGGNDYPVKAMGVESIAIQNWQQTVDEINKILASTNN